MIVNKYYIVGELRPDTEATALSLGASAIIIGIPGYLKDVAAQENWNLPHLWVEEFEQTEQELDSVTQLL